MAVFDVITKHSRIGNTINYICNAEKTTLRGISIKEFFGGESACFLFGGKLITGINCHVDNAREEMVFVQTRFAQRHSGIECYHGIQSFRMGEVTALECHRIGVEFAERYWGDEYQVLIATHVNTDQYHNHFAINPVSMWNGKKWQFRKSELNKCRQLSDKICIEQGLSVIAHSSKGSAKILNQIERSGGPTKYNLMRESLDRVLDFTTSIEEFYVCMRYEGYIIGYQGSEVWNCTIKTAFDQNEVALTKLGEYSDEKIKDCFEANKKIDHSRRIIDYRKHIKEENHFIDIYRMEIEDDAIGSYEVNSMTINEQYESLMKILDPPYDSRRKGDGKPLVFSPECKLAYRRVRWHAQMRDLCVKYGIKKESDILQRIVSLSKRLEKVSCVAEKKAIKKDIKELQSLRRHCHKIPRLLKAERQEEYERCLIFQEGMELPTMQLKPKYIFPSVSPSRIIENNTYRMPNTLRKERISVRRQLALYREEEKKDYMKGREINTNYRKVSSSIDNLEVQ